jgi:hypothetical protein
VRKRKRRGSLQPIHPAPDRAIIWLCEWAG